MDGKEVSFGNENYRILSPRRNHLIKYLQFGEFRWLI